MKPEVLLIALLVSIAGIVIGIFLIRKPSRVIDMQKAFYLGINWRMEPVSLPREIASTRMMGMLLVIVCILSFLTCLARLPHALAFLSASCR